MIRWACLLIAVTACAGSGPPPARLFAEGAGGCPDPAGCGVALDEEPKYASPDDAHDVPGDPADGADQPREATCSDVGISAASIEIGNYASAKDRAPIETKYRGRCRTTRLDATERHCVSEAGDAMSIAYCAPRFWPQQVVSFVEVTACAGIAQQIRDRSKTQPDGHSTADQWDRQLSAVQRSCEEDRWTVAFGDCARTMPDLIYLESYCQHVAPGPLFTRLMDRIANVK